MYICIYIYTFILSMVSVFLFYGSTQRSWWPMLVHADRYIVLSSHGNYLNVIASSDNKIWSNVDHPSIFQLMDVK